MKVVFPKTSGIYQIYCIPTQKCYIGSALNLQRRWMAHRSNLRKGNHRNRYLQNAWNKYGESAFDCVIVEHTDRSEVLLREQHYLDLLQPFRRDVGYNIGHDACAAMLGKTHTLKTRQKMANSRKGKKRDPEIGCKVSLAQKGKKVSSEHLANITKANQRPRSEKELEMCRQWGFKRKGRKVSEETKRRQSESIKIALAKKRSSQTHCKHGHPWNEVNTKFHLDKRTNFTIRSCKQCQTLNRKKRKEKQNENHSG